MAIEYAIMRSGEVAQLEEHSGNTKPHDTTSMLIKRSIRDFLDRMNVVSASFPRDHELEERVQAEVDSWKSKTATMVGPHILTSVIGAVAVYGHIPNIETRVQIALFTAIILSLDDPDVMNSLDSGDFHHHFVCGEMQRDAGLFGQLTRILHKMWDHYPRFSASAISASALQFVNMTILENETKHAVLHTSALPFLEYRRTLSATAEAYACFIWDKARFPDITMYMQAIPDTMLYVGYVNDILSFYKEELAGESGNYIGDRALLSRNSAVETFQQVINEAVAATERVRRILGAGPALDAWECFAKGYIEVHIKSPRYRLQEMLDDML